MIKKDRKKKKDRKRHVDRDEYICQNCGKHLEYMCDYQWQCMFCDVGCGMELYGLSWRDLA